MYGPSKRDISYLQKLVMSILFKSFTEKVLLGSAPAIRKCQ
jgi:hypothetical protein